MKILMNYFQIINIINLLEIKWNSAVNDIQIAGKTFSGSFFKVISLDCLFQGKIILIFFNFNNIN